jgi:hypothetical protein
MTNSDFQIFLFYSTIGLHLKEKRSTTREMNILALANCATFQKEKNAKFGFKKNSNSDSSYLTL